MAIWHPKQRQNSYDVTAWDSSQSIVDAEIIVDLKHIQQSMHTHTHVYIIHITTRACKYLQISALNVNHRIIQ